MTDAMTAHILDSLVFSPDIPALLKRLRIKEGSENAGELLRLLDQARLVARPRAMYFSAYITGRGEDWVEIDGQRFNSRILQVNLAQAYRVFPFLATCGQELQVWADSFEDMLLNYWAEAIKEAALACAIKELNQNIEAVYRPGHTAAMNPGSLEDWPITQQRALFDLFGSYSIGVDLTDSLLMIPTKSVSGIRFPTEASFESCQLCPRENCPGRRAPYDVELYAHSYA